MVRRQCIAVLLVSLHVCVCVLCPMDVGLLCQSARLERVAQCRLHLFYIMRAPACQDRHATLLQVPNPAWEGKVPTVLVTQAPRPPCVVHNVHVAVCRRTPWQRPWPLDACSNRCFLQIAPALLPLPPPPEWLG